MIVVNAFAARVMDVLMRPASGLPPLVSLALVSLVTAVAMLLVARLTADQRAVADAKRAIEADLFEVRLFNDDLRAIFRALGAMSGHTIRYLRSSLVPALWLALPFTLVAAHLDPFYGYTGLVPGQTALVTAAFPPAADPPPATLDSPPSVRVDSPGIWFPATGEMVWRVTPTEDGPTYVHLQVGSLSVLKTLQVSDRVVRRSPVRASSVALLDEVLNPSEPPLPPGAVLSVSVAYPEARVQFWRWEVSWLVAYLSLSIAWAMTLRKSLGVEL